MNAVFKPKHTRNKGLALNKEEILLFITKANSSICKNIFLFYLYSGCRRSEALSLTWNDIDFNNKTIRIKGTKTTASDRTIPLFKDLELLLNSLLKSDNYVFHFTADYVTREFKRICPQHRLHDLRHTFATRCLECGISIKVVQKWLGHTRLETTASIYTHIFDNFVKAEANKFCLI